MATLLAVRLVTLLWEASAQASEPSVGVPFNVSAPLTNSWNNLYGTGRISAVANNGKGYLVVWEKDGDIYGARVTSGGHLVDTNGIVICASTNQQFSPAVASDGSQYLVVWQECHQASTGAEFECDSIEIRGARVTADGRVLDTNSITISALPSELQGRPAVASNGSEYLVVRDVPSFGVSGTKVSIEGVAFDTERRVLLNGPGWMDIAVASNGTNYLVVSMSGTPPGSSIEGIRVASDLTLLDSGPLQLSRADWPFFQHAPAVASTGGDYLVVWMDNFASPVGGPSPRPSEMDIFGTRVTGAGIVLDQYPLHICTAAGWQGSPRVAGLEGGYVATWQDSRDGTNNSIYTTLVTKSGAIPDTEGTHVASGSEIHAYPDVASDGRDCLITYVIDGPAGPQRVRANLYYASRVPTLSAVDIIPVCFSLQSFGFSQGGVLFGKDRTIFASGSGGSGGRRGFNVAVVTLPNLAVDETRNFDTWADRSSGGAHSAFVDYLHNIPNGRLVLVAVGDEAGLNLSGDSRCESIPSAWADAVIDELQRHGSTNIGNYCYNDSWGMIFIKGHPRPLAEGLGSGETFPSASVRLHAVFPKTIPKPSVSISTQGGGDFATYALTVTNVIADRDLRIQYTDDFQGGWQHLRTLNNPSTNVVQVSDFIMFSPARSFRAVMDSSIQLPPGF